VQVVDDFLRNFLLKMGMTSTLDCFETEWYELAATGQLKSEDVSAVPDVYLRNQELDDLAKVSLRRPFFAHLVRGVLLSRERRRLEGVPTVVQAQARGTD
jgi:hypothetical protein